MIATYKPGAMDSGGAGICNTPPTPLAPPVVGKYFVGGFAPVLAVSYTHLTLPTMS